MTKLLEGLLSFAGATGGQVILLSATLSQGLRQRLLHAFYRFQEVKPQLQNHSFPLLTHAHAQGVNEIAIPCGPPQGQTKTVEFLQSQPEVIACLQTALAAGQCALWIRNSVDDCLEAALALAQVGIPAASTLVFHSRFSQGDRNQIEQEVLTKFGKASTQADRAGQLLLATQVVEQSLDLDFDCLISDLCPMDLIIQRAGRLHRHQRDAQGNPCNGNDQRAKPVLHVFAPAWAETPNEDWFQQVFPRAAWVYTNHAQLWLTMKELKNRQGLNLPQDSRSLIEAVYGAEAAAPAGLAAAEQKAKSSESAQRSVGMLNLINFSQGYSSLNQNAVEDVVVSTRLGEEGCLAYLALEGQPLGESWRMAQIRLPGRWLSGLPGQRYHEPKLNSNLPNQGRYAYLFPLQPLGEDLWEILALDKNSQPLTLHYHRRWGLYRPQRINLNLGGE